MANKKKENKAYTISVRFNKKEYEQIERKTKKFGISKSDYIRNKSLKQETVLGNVVFEHIRCVVQEILNYLEDKYNGDEKIERWCKELWSLF